MVRRKKKLPPVRGCHRHGKRGCHRCTDKAPNGANRDTYRIYQREYQRQWRARKKEQMAS